MRLTCIPLLLLIAALVVAGCGDDKGATREIIQREGEPDYIRTSDDELLEKAVAEAKRTLPTFDETLRAKAANTTDFALKKGFGYGEDGGEEHIWLINVEPTENGYRGEINNDPVEATFLKLGEIVEIKPEEVSDWMYFEDGKLRGGYTVVALTYGTEQQERLQRMMNIDWSRYEFLNAGKPQQE